MGVCPAFDLTEGAKHVALPSTGARFAFTLTEVLLAVVIVGVLAALVLPAVVTHFQEKGFAQAYVRETKTIQSAIEGLAVNENKASFFETMMYKDAEPENYSDNAELFLKKYLRVSKICGDNNGDCFAKTYYSYENHDKKVYKPEYKGSCAVLKNGSSICLTPQVGASPIVGLVDLNGPKGPNILHKDLRPFSLAAETRLGHHSDIAAVLDYDFDPIKEKEDPCMGKTCGCGTLPPCDPCEGKTCGCGSLPPCEVQCNNNPNKWDLTCCEKYSGSITSPSHHCCTFSSIKNSNPKCKSKLSRIYFECVSYTDDGIVCYARTNDDIPFSEMPIQSLNFSMTPIIYNIADSNWQASLTWTVCSSIKQGGEIAITARRPPDTLKVVRGPHFGPTKTFTISRNDPGSHKSFVYAERGAMLCNPLESENFAHSTYGYSIKIPEGSSYSWSGSWFDFCYGCPCAWSYTISDYEAIQKSIEERYK